MSALLTVLLSCGPLILLARLLDWSFGTDLLAVLRGLLPQ